MSQIKLAYERWESDMTILCQVGLRSFWFVKKVVRHTIQKQETDMLAQDDHRIPDSCGTPKTNTGMQVWRYENRLKLIRKLHLRL
jgi:hypothetical protein